MIFKSKLFRRNFAAVVTISLLYFTCVYFLVIPKIKEIAYKQEEQSAKTLLDTVYEIVRVYYYGIKAYERYALESHKRDVKNVVSIALSHINNYYRDYEEGKLTLEEVKRKVLHDIRSWRFGKDNYVFVIDGKGRLIAHPWVPYGENVLNLRDIKGNYVIRKIIKAAHSSPQGGFTRYWWKKIGSSEPVEKLTYAAVFKPFNWVVGSGVYIDDVSREIEHRREQAIEEISRILRNVKIGSSGYVFIFDSKGRVVIHPDRRLIGKESFGFRNALTGGIITKELIKAADTGRPVVYLWYKPGHGDKLAYKKLAWSRYFDGFGWYIVASVYQDDLFAGAGEIARRITLLSLITLIVVIALSYYFFSRLISPLRELSKMAEEVRRGNLSARSSVKRDDEIGLLSEVFDSMVEELSDHIENLDRKVNQRTKELREKNEELRRTLKELRQTQKQLVESEKMAALGGLVAGVAHEINTPLGIGITAASHIKELSQQLLELYRKGELTRSEFERKLSSLIQSSQIVLSNLNRAAELVKSFKQVAVDQSTGELRRINLKKYLEELLVSLRPKWKKTGHRVELECPAGLEITTYPGALAQVITNLIVNSLIHGFEGIKNGVIRLKFYRRGNRVVFEYSDNGRGVPPELLGKIFEPFFTTKRGKGGTGLGLHLVYNLITQKLKGKISCWSEPGKGIKFTIELPDLEGENGR